MAYTYSPNNPPAYMGFVGFVRLTGTAPEGLEGGNGLIVGDVTGGSDLTHGPYVIRATTADITLKQEITRPEIVDSRYDKTVYQLGPKIIDGSLAFPAIYDLPEGETTPIFEVLYRYAVTRVRGTGSLNLFNIDVKYAGSDANNQAEFTYGGCIVNTWKFAVAQSDVVTCSIDIIGTSRYTAVGMTTPKRGDTACIPVGEEGHGSISTTRVITWADARVELWPGRGASVGFPIKGEYIRTFEANINNNAERFYTLNRNLQPQAVAPRKRDVSGSITLMGRNTTISNLANSNEISCRESSQLKFGYKGASTGEGCTGTNGENIATFGVTLPNVIFEIEQMKLTNDLFETTVNWSSLPGGGLGVCDPMLYSLVEGGGTTFVD
jgi:hypothetical protein